MKDLPVATEATGDADRRVMASRTAHVLRLAGMALVVSVLVGAVAAGSSSEASPTSGSLIEFWDGTSWTQQNPNSVAYLNAVGATSANDAWAVGFGGHEPALAAHWDGSSWQQVAMSTPADRFNFGGIATVSTTDAWAVGWHGKTHETLPLIEHWNGSAWTIAEGPEPGKNSVLNGVAALSPRNVWAVGSYTPYGDLERPLVLHWNGRAWKRIRPPLGLIRSSSGSWLSAVAVVSARNVWAVGGYNPRRSGSVTSTLVLHWNGKTLRRVPSTNPGGDRGLTHALTDVAAVGRNNVWAVGATDSSRRSQKPPPHPLIEHWNGHSWRTVPSPKGFTQCHPSALTALAPLARNDIWAAGTAICEVSGVGATGHALAEHWNGKAWSVSPIVNPPSSLGYSYFSDIVAASHHAVWSVGYSS